MVPPYVVVVPVKPPALGKSRIVGLDHETRRGLARAFALDTVAACLAADHVGAVLVATDDAAFSRELGALGCATIPDGDTNDLNSALRQAVAEARRRWADHAPVALCADLPALRPAELTLALESVVPGGPSFVADAEGVGTTLYTAPYAGFDPRPAPPARGRGPPISRREPSSSAPTWTRSVVTSTTSRTCGQQWPSEWGRRRRPWSRPST